MKKVQKILVRKGKKINVDGRERTIIKEKINYVYDTDKDYSTEKGTIKKEEFKKKEGSKIKTNKDAEYIMFSPSFIDQYNKIQRLAQIVPLKDIGSIIVETGINKNSKIVDAGSGSGALAIMLANFAKEVITYDIREDHHNVVMKNIESLNIKNVEAKMGSVYDSIPEKNIDLFTLDLPEPWKAIETVKTALNIGGFCVVYNPSITQITDFVNNINKDGNFIILKVVEIIERFWEVAGRKVRPKTEGIGHSGFLVFIRKIS